MPATQTKPNFVHVREKLLAATLLSLDIPLKKKVKGFGGEFPGITNVYSDKHKFRNNGRIVEGNVTYHFEPFSRDGKLRTDALVQAWDEAGEYMERKDQPQAYEEIERLYEKIEANNLTDEERHSLIDRLRFWHHVLIVQQNRVAYSQFSWLKGIITSPKILPPMGLWKRPNGKYNFYTPANPESHL